MKVSVSLEGGDELRARMAGWVERSQHLQPGLLRAGAAVLKFAQQNIDTGGGDESWPPNVSGTPLLHGTGRLFGSLAAGGSGNIDQADDRTVVVGTNVTVGDGYNLGQLMQGGTGIYAGHGVITPTSSSALSFLIRGRRVTVRSVKGSPKRPFLYINQEVAQTIATILGSYVQGRDSGGS